jgi:uncharacterized protein
VDKSLPRVVDDANLLDAAEEDELRAQVEMFLEAHAFDVVIVTKQSIGEQTPMEYADDYFDYMGYGWREEETEDITAGTGILLLVSMAERDYYVSVKPAYAGPFSDSVVEDLAGEFRPYLSDGNYAEAFAAFVYGVDGYMTSFESGEFIEGDSGAEADDGGDGDYNEWYEQNGRTNSSYVTVRWSGNVFLVGVVFSLVIALIVCALMRSKMNTARPQAQAQDYLRPGSFQLTHSNDMFLYSHTSSVRIESESHSSSSGSFQSSGSHTSSSGSSHSGGGGKF